MGMLDGKVAIVTGAGRGLGRSHAEALAAAGASVIVNDLGIGLHGEDDSESHAPADEVVAVIKAAGGNAVAHYGNAASWGDGEALVQSAIDHFGRLDILVNNAGIIRDRMSWKMAEAEWDGVIAVHLKGHFTATRAAIAYWREQAKAGERIAGRVINTTSEAGLYGNAGQVNYGAAKAGILGLQNVLVEETRQMNLTINAISPRAASRMAGAGLTEDMASASQVSPLVVYLSSDSAADINGQVFLNYGGTLKLLKAWEEAAEVNQTGGFTCSDIEPAVRKLFENNDSVKPPFIPKL
ncbi:MAG: SDR family NAD(P)-dependent oxidoreductase [Pseudomonadales bacterium]